MVDDQIVEYDGASVMPDEMGRSDAYLSQDPVRRDGLVLLVVADVEPFTAEVDGLVEWQAQPVERRELGRLGRRDLGCLLGVRQVQDHAAKPGVEAA